MLGSGRAAVDGTPLAGRGGAAGGGDASGAAGGICGGAADGAGSAARVSRRPSRSTPLRRPVSSSTCSHGGSRRAHTAAGRAESVPPSVTTLSCCEQRRSALTNRTSAAVTAPGRPNGKRPGALSQRTLGRTGYLGHMLLSSACRFLAEVASMAHASGRRRATRTLPFVAVCVRDGLHVTCLVLVPGRLRLPLRLLFPVAPRRASQLRAHARGRDTREAATGRGQLGDAGQTPHGRCTRQPMAVAYLTGRRRATRVRPRRSPWPPHLHVQTREIYESIHQHVAAPPPAWAAPAQRSTRSVTSAPRSAGRSPPPAAPPAPGPPGTLPPCPVSGPAQTAHPPHERKARVPVRCGQRWRVGWVANRPRAASASE